MIMRRLGKYDKDPIALIRPMLTYVNEVEQCRYFIDTIRFVGQYRRTFPAGTAGA